MFTHMATEVTSMHKSLSNLTQRSSVTSRPSHLNSSTPVEHIQTQPLNHFAYYQFDKHNARILSFTIQVPLTPQNHLFQILPPANRTYTF